MKNICIWFCNAILAIVVVALFEEKSQPTAQPPEVIPAVAEEVAEEPPAVQPKAARIGYPGPGDSPRNLSSDPTLELLDALEENLPDHEFLWPVVYAIRRSENGGPGREFGILVKGVDTYRQQAGWCAATVRKNYERWLKTKPADPMNIPVFIVFLGSKYCPVGASNDPTGLNKNWVGNVTDWYEVYRGI